MSAIYGCFSSDGKEADLVTFARVAESFTSWGPDALDTHQEGGFMLGGCALVLSARRAQTLWRSFDTGIVILADAVLDDRAALGALLGLSSQDLSKASDPELIGRAWTRWGEACLTHLFGDFAFAVVEPAKRRLVLVRDHIGTRPLFYGAFDNAFCFASSGAAVHILAGRAGIDESAVAAFLDNPMDVPEANLLEGVFRVPPGGMVIADSGAMSVRRWWNPWALPKVPTDTEEGYIRSFRKLVERAVHDRIECNHPIGSHISGGVDSTLVTRIAARLAKDRGNRVQAAFAWAPEVSEPFPESATDERQRILCDAAAVDVDVVFNERQSDGLERLINRPMESEGIADVADEFAVLQNAKRLGIRLILSGWGGDEAFSPHGHGLPSHLLATGKWRRLATHIRQRQGGRIKSLKAMVYFLRHAVVPLLPTFIAERATLPGPGIRFRLARRKQVRNLPNGRFRKPLRPTADPRDYLKRLIANGHIGERMQTWAHWGAEYGIQYRYPLTDRRLLEFILGLPVDILYWRDQSRILPYLAFKNEWPKGVAKDDPANEARRYGESMATWRKWADLYPTLGTIPDCPWIDRPSLHAALHRSHSNDTVQNVAAFAEILTAMRVLRMYERSCGWLTQTKEPQ